MIGRSSSDEAKIGGMTPAVFSFSGRCEESPWNMRLPICRFGYWIRSRRCARSTKTMKAMTTTDITITTRMTGGQRALAAELERAGDRRRDVGDDAGEDDERDAVADAARGDLLAEPHQEHGAAGQRDDRGEAEEPAGIGHDVAGALKPDGDAVGLEHGQHTVR